ncbi:MAG: S-adenosyl-l-methionine hydroxide adenosyltransferase family protein [Bacteroidia bacterium]
MAIITLTSDLGTRSQYAAILQGVIYTLCSEAKIVEITHEVPNFDILEAAFILKNTYHFFPKGTIHLIAVDPNWGEQKNGVIMKLNDHYFISPDNGIFSLIAENQAAEYIAIQTDKIPVQEFPRSFRVGGILAPTAAVMANGGDMNELGTPCKVKELYWGEPISTKKGIRGKIIHIDKFGNAITNITRNTFLEAKKDRSFVIVLRNMRIRKIYSTYSDVSKGEALAIFGQSGHLEISMREAAAAELLGLKVHDMISIEFGEEKVKG